MKYILKTIDGNKYKITEEEYKNINNVGQFIHFKSINSVINKTSISQIYPENKSDLIEDRKKQITGILRDGTRVRRAFGRWAKLEKYDYLDESGNYRPMYIDPYLYPEVVKDTVMTEIEYQEYSELPIEDRMKISEEQNPKMRIYEGMTDLKKILTSKKL